MKSLLRKCNFVIFIGGFKAKNPGSRDGWKRGFALALAGLLNNDWASN
jgi:hypothetical protein